MWLLVELDRTSEPSDLIHLELSEVVDFFSESAFNNFQQLVSAYPEIKRRSDVDELRDVIEAESWIAERSDISLPKFGEKYETVRLIGSGGFASVFHAKWIHQGGETISDVAIKYLNEESDQIPSDVKAAGYDCENIVKVLDTDKLENRHFIVMPLIKDGCSLSKLLEPQQNASIDQDVPIKLIWRDLTAKEKAFRIASIGAQIAYGLMHAHSDNSDESLLHGDLSPNNIMVRLRKDESPPFLAQIIDFGISRIIESSSKPKGLNRQFASPEQIYEGVISRIKDGLMPGKSQNKFDFIEEVLRHAKTEFDLDQRVQRDLKRYLSKVDASELNIVPKIDNRSDIFSLGKTLEWLYIDAKKNEWATPGSNKTQCLNDIQKKDGLYYAIEKASHPCPECRYQSADLFKKDLDLFLVGKTPTVAPTYDRICNFVSRHRVLALVSLGATVLFFATLLVFVWRQKVLEQQAAKDAQNIATLFLEYLNSQTNPYAKRNSEIDELLSESSDKIHRVFGRNPNLEAQVRATLSGILLNQGEFELAYFQAEKAVECDPTKIDILIATNWSLGNALVEQSKFREAEKHYESLARLIENKSPAKTEDTWILQVQQARLYRKLGRYEEALTYAKASEGLASNTQSNRQELGVIYHRLAQYKEACTIFRQVLEYRISSASGQSSISDAQENLAQTLVEAGLFDEAEQLYNEARNTRRTFLGPQHPNTLLVERQYAFFLLRQGKWDEADSLLKSVAENQEKKLGHQSFEYVKSRHLQSMASECVGKSAIAITISEDVEKEFSSMLGRDHPYVFRAKCQHFLGKCRFSRQFDISEAAKLLEQLKLYQPKTQKNWYRPIHHAVEAILWGYVYAPNPKFDARADELSRRLVDEHSCQPQIRLLRGAVLLRLKDYKKAVTELDQSKDKSVEQELLLAIAKSHLGDTTNGENVIKKYSKQIKNEASRVGVLVEELESLLNSKKQ